MSFDRSTLWLTLQKNSLVSGNMPEKDNEATPWYVRVMLGISGWIGALFLLGFLALAFSDVFDSEFVCGVLGSLAMFAAYFIFLKKHDDFSEQFAFVISMVGQCLITFAFFQSSKSTVFAGFLMIIVYALLFCKIDNFLHQVWSAMGSVVSLIVVLWDLKLFSTMSSVLLIGFALIWSKEFDRPHLMAKLQALGYGVTLVMLCHIWIDSGAGWSEALRAESRWVYFGAPAEYWLGVIMNAAVLVKVVTAIAKKFSQSLKSLYKIPLCFVLMIVAIAFLKLPGLAVTLVVLLVGFSHSNRVLVGLGALSTLAYIAQYYYFMEIILLEKSVILTLSGSALLILRTWIKCLSNKSQNFNALGGQ